MFANWLTQYFFKWKMLDCFHFLFGVGAGPILKESLRNHLRQFIWFRNIIKKCSEPHKFYSFIFFLNFAKSSLLQTLKTRTAGVRFIFWPIGDILPYDWCVLRFFPICWTIWSFYTLKNSTSESFYESTNYLHSLKMLSFVTKMRSKAQIFGFRLCSSVTRTYATARSRGRTFTQRNFPRKGRPGGARAHPQNRQAAW